MSLHQVSTFVLVCEHEGFFGPGIGCGRELLAEQVRGPSAAEEYGRSQGWRVDRPGPWDSTDKHLVPCPYCEQKRQTAVDRHRAHVAAGGADSGA